MRQALELARVKDPQFAFTKDDVHPGREGQWVMAKEILSQTFGAKLDGVADAEHLFAAHGEEIRKWIVERMALRFD